ncbi:hypothetical protein KUCAC02_036076 [Chaenocephalus aceratus]|nr:hypothetical protein KUCAC02_036076 [Chaenocephalus aceratus]
MDGGLGEMSLHSDLGQDGRAMLHSRDLSAAFPRPSLGGPSMSLEPEPRPPGFDHSMSALGYSGDSPSSSGSTYTTLTPLQPFDDKFHHHHQPPPPLPAGLGSSMHGYGSFRQQPQWKRRADAPRRIRRPRGKASSAGTSDFGVRLSPPGLGGGDVSQASKMGETPSLHVLPPLSSPNESMMGGSQGGGGGGGEEIQHPGTWPKDHHRAEEVQHPPGHLAERVLCRSQGTLVHLLRTPSPGAS